jgi:hypothetical protein
VLVKFTIDGGSAPVTRQAREEVLEDRLRILNQHDPAAENVARETIRLYLRSHTEFTAAHIACTGNGDEWHPEFESLYDALLAVSNDAQQAHEEAAKFLGLLVWNEALRDGERWHFTSYPKTDSDLMVTHYFALDGHIRASAKLKQAASARDHGQEDRADDLEETARQLMARWRRNVA